MPPKIIPTEILLKAYKEGIFPMADSSTGEITWHAPHPRAIIPLKEFKVSRSLRQTIKKNIFEIRFDTAFEQVMRECAKREETWISELIIRSYVKLFEEGHAHSVETWREGKLVGGLYGVSIGGAFFGESMFSRETDASKVALVALVDHMRSRKFELLDTQFITEHLKQFGAIEVHRERYQVLLTRALNTNRTFF